MTPINLNDAKLAILLMELRDKRTAAIDAEKALQTAIETATAGGRLVRYGDLAEFAPYVEATDIFAVAAVGLGDYLRGN